MRLPESTTPNMNGDYYEKIKTNRCIMPCYPISCTLYYHTHSRLSEKSAGTACLSRLSHRNYWSACRALCNDACLQIPKRKKRQVNMRDHPRHMQTEAHPYQTASSLCPYALSYQSARSVNNLMTPRSIGNHSNWRFNFLLNRLDIIATFFRKVLVFLDTPNLALPPRKCL